MGMVNAYEIQRIKIRESVYLADSFNVLIEKDENKFIYY